MTEREGGLSIAVGTDLIEISRIGKAYRRWGERFLKRVYTEEEREYFKQTRNENLIVSEMAARFAGKEAVAKALGTGLKILGSKTGSGVGWKEIEILNESSGEPFVRLHGRAQEVALKKRIFSLDISLTHIHIEDLAEAIVVALKQEKFTLRMVLASLASHLQGWIRSHLRFK